MTVLKALLKILFGQLLGKWQLDLVYDTPKEISLVKFTVAQNWHSQFIQQIWHFLKLHPLPKDLDGSHWGYLG